MSQKSNEIVEVFSGNLWEAELLKSMLDDAEIRSFLKNTVLTSFAYKPSYSQAVKVMVFVSDWDKAVILVKQLAQNSREL